MCEASLKVLVRLELDKSDPVIARIRPGYRFSWQLSSANDYTKCRLSDAHYIVKHPLRLTSVGHEENKERLFYLFTLIDIIVLYSDVFTPI